MATLAGKRNSQAVSLFGNPTWIHYDFAFHSLQPFYDKLNSVIGPREKIPLGQIYVDGAWVGSMVCKRKNKKIEKERKKERKT